MRWLDYHSEFDSLEGEEEEVEVVVAMVVVVFTCEKEGL